MNRLFTNPHLLIEATSEVLYNTDFLGNYKFYTMNDKDIRYIEEIKNAETYFKRFEEIVKDKVFKNISNINTIKCHVKLFDENISFHLFVKKVSKILEQFIKDTLTKQYPYYAYHINKHNINFNKTIVVEITDNDKTIFVANLDISPFV